MAVGAHALALDLAAQAHAIGIGGHGLVGHHGRPVQAAGPKSDAQRRQQLGASAVARREQRQRALEEGDLRRQVTARGTSPSSAVSASRPSQLRASARAARRAGAASLAARWARRAGCRSGHCPATRRPAPRAIRPGRRSARAASGIAA